MASNSQQFGNRLDSVSKPVSEVSVSSLEQQIAGLTSLVRQLAVGNMQTVKACGICSVVGHPTDACPTLQEAPTEQVNAMGGFFEQSQRRYDPYANTYNLGWRDHPYLSYANPQVNQPTLLNRPNFQQYQQPYPQQQGQTSNSDMSLENIVKALASNTLQFQQETKASIQNLENQVSQLATTINRMETQNSRKLPSQTVVNPRENVSAIFLRSGKEDESSTKVIPTPMEQEEEKSNIADKGLPNDKETVATLGDSPKSPQSGNDPCIESSVSNKCNLPSVLQASIPDLKPLPNDFKYVFLGDEKTLPVIISSELSTLQEEKLVQILKKHKRATGGISADIQGIDPPSCMLRYFQFAINPD